MTLYQTRNTHVLVDHQGIAWFRAKDIGDDYCKDGIAIEWYKLPTADIEETWSLSEIFIRENSVGRRITDKIMPFIRSRHRQILVYVTNEIQFFNKSMINQ